MFNFVRNGQSVFQSLYAILHSFFFFSILHSYQQLMSFCCFISSLAFGIFTALDFGHSKRCVVIFNCCFNLIFLMTYDVSIFSDAYLLSVFL